ncbi:hypothetical protein KQ939_09540 [Planococcus sp. CP5-4]|uniref:hypothetical protein n=1 Tax=unclassified Planococcus (in: firmicutes) TaxID=2662419 RepID=UPI001C21798D|nr:MULTISPECIES: hypothetical protein [unclassified Planococcus (in: firmicutes)]MBU9673778.1 hypothetical protein [Planococcus sp. CP5-4_YE]MBV0908906.1 hypothetical protein [Planococcus sp. CP5-4_UN]MBW6063955.1 hypothetical protein [Planococcus sp. CP5-4]
MKIHIKKSLYSTLATSILLMGTTSGVSAHETAGSIDPQTYEAYSQQDAKYSKKVVKAISEVLEMDANSQQAVAVINQLPKIMAWEYYLSSFGKKLKGNEIRQAVEEVFDIDLDYVSKNDYGSKLSIYPTPVMESVRVSLKEEITSVAKDARIMNMSKNEVMDRYIKQQNYALSGAQASLLINQIFGVNLVGISGLEGKQLAISSKGQWIVKSDRDLFILESSLDDVDVSIYAGSHLQELTGGSELPAPLIAKLTELGFTYHETEQLLYYKNPTGESIPDAFKGQLIGILLGTIAQMNG